MCSVEAELSNLVSFGLFIAMISTEFRVTLSILSLDLKTFYKFLDKFEDDDTTTQSPQIIVTLSEILYII